MVGKNAWLYVVLAVTALFSVRLRNTAFIDEALYLNAGKNYLAHWFGGADLPVGTGDLFSGVPVLYPVLAGALDNVGGLYLVRAFSLLCVLGTAVLIQRTTRAMFGGQSGTLAAAAFCFTGSVIFIGWFATFDALCILLLAAGAYVGVTRHGNKSLQVVAENPVSGRYLSSVADPLAYHTRDAYPGIRWESPYGLYADPATIDDVIAKGEYEQVVLWNESTGSPQQDAGQAALIDALNASDIYELRESSGHEADKWLFYSFRTKGQ
jgi:hypothetical protein